MKRITRNSTHFKTVAVTKGLYGLEWNYVVPGNTAMQVGNHAPLLGAFISRYHGNKSKPELIEVDLNTFDQYYLPMIDELPRLHAHYTFLVDDSLVVISSADLVGVDVFKIDLLLASWNRLEALTIPPFRIDNIICEFIEQSLQVVFFGGCSPTKEELVRVFTLSLESFEWSILNPSGTGPTPRYGHASCSISSSSETTIFVFGGRHNGRVCNDLHALLCGTGRYRWSKIMVDSSVLPTAYLGMTCLSGMIFIFGGLDRDMEECSQLARCDIDDSTWATFGHCQDDLKASAFHKLLVVESTGFILSFGGLYNSFDDISLLKPL